MIVARQILVSGVVQGVGYRAFAQRTARELGVCGFVRNLHDGRVEIFAEGDAKIVDALVVACWKGPTHAEVDDVAQTAKPPRGATAFHFVDDADAPEP